jgi:hypothetical protein
MKKLPHRGLLFLALLLVVGGCRNDEPTKPVVPPASVVPDFKIEDVNPNSVTHGDSISPREYLGQISCWYFGHAT